MILTCPACATRYRVADQEFEGSSGRTVRCANCGYLWHEKNPMQSSPAARPAVAPNDREPGVDVSAAKAPPGSLPRLEIPPNSRLGPPRARPFASRIALLLVLIVAVAGAWIFARGYFAEERAPASLPKVISNAPTPLARPPIGLVIRKVTPARTADGLVVTGEIANPGNEPRDVPRLRVALQDTADKVVQSATVDPPKARLEPGEVVHFEIPFAHPPDAATGVVVTFTSS